MGAHNFESGEYGRDAQDAFEKAQDQALYESGHNPYNGTISTVRGFVMIPLEEGEDAESWHHRILDDPRVQKWEACACRVDDEIPEKNGRKYYIFAGWAAC